GFHADLVDFVRLDGAEDLFLLRRRVFSRLFGNVVRVSACGQQDREQDDCRPHSPHYLLSRGAPPPLDDACPQRVRTRRGRAWPQAIHYSLAALTVSATMYRHRRRRCTPE